ncbi:hypothetical protein HJC23_000804 [Cyclotella cryptica]|uniref:Uncharacterized protein n=1 Tax=Cyclotella cryptica TaxID=29204 RepID=A0ABD3Q611_9STRA
MYQIVGIFDSMTTSPFWRRKSQSNSNSETIVWIGGFHGKNQTDVFTSGLESSTIHRRSSKARLEVKSAVPKADGAKKRKSISTVRSILKSRSPKRDRDGDIFFSPYQNNEKDPSAETTSTNGDKSRSVTLGSQSIIDEETSVDRRLRTFDSISNDTEDVSTRHGRLQSIVIPKGRPTLSSLESDTTATKDLEAAVPLSPKRFVDANLHVRDERKVSTCQTREKRQSNDDHDEEAPCAQRQVRNVATAEGQPHSTRKIHSSDGAKRRRLSKRARTRLTTREVNSHIQPGRSFSTLESMSHFEKRKKITLPKIFDFFLRIEGKLVAVNVAVSAVLTLIVVHAFPKKWQDSLKGSAMAVSILGAFLSFALVFRTQTCYSRWWEARTQWGRMTSACVNVAGQARNWFSNEDLVDKFLTHCIVFPYACKASLRGNHLNDAMEEGPRFLHSGMLTDADLGVIIRHGRPPFVCLEIMRRTMYEAFRDRNECDMPHEIMNGVLLSMEQSLWELNLNFGACLKINGTRMPASYTVFMRSFVIFFFVLATFTWSPALKWLTPVITCFMVILINTVIVIGDQMMHPFDLQWAGLALQKFCVVIENEVMNVSRRHADISCLFHDHDGCDACGQE